MADILTRRYNQDAVTVIVNGKPVQGLAEGSPVVITPLGGEVEVTQGTNGPGMNMATDQGGKIALTLMESSPDNLILQGYRRLQEHSDIAFPVVIYTGTRAIVTLTDAVISLPGELQTGDKKQGSRTYEFTGTRMIQA